MVNFSDVDVIRFREFVPDSVRLVSDLCGSDVALKLVQHYGGGHVHVPHKAAAGHPLFELLGQVGCSRLCESFGGECLTIPKGTAMARYIRNTRIHELRAQGAKLADIARSVSLTERQIFTILKRFNPVASG